MPKIYTKIDDDTLQIETSASNIMQSMTVVSMNVRKTFLNRIISNFQGRIDIAQEEIDGINIALRKLEELSIGETVEDASQVSDEKHV